MGVMDEKQDFIKKAEERAKAMAEKEKALWDADKASKAAKTEDDVKSSSKQVEDAWKGYSEETRKGESVLKESGGILRKILSWFGL